MDTLPSQSAARLTTRFKIWFFCGTLLLLGVVFKGVGGYQDHLEYLEMSQNLWLKGDLAVDSKVHFGGRYHRYPTGLALISWPSVYVGQVAEWLSGRPV